MSIAKPGSIEAINEYNATLNPGDHVGVVIDGTWLYGTIESTVVGAKLARILVVIEGRRQIVAVTDWELYNWNLS